MVKKSKMPVKARKKRTSSQNLKREFERLKNHSKKNGWLLSDNEDWSDPIKRGSAANEVLSFGRETAGQAEGALDNYGAPLRKAFRAAGLKPDNPQSWRVLLRIFASFHFALSDKDQERAQIAMTIHTMMARGDKKYVAVENLAKHLGKDEKTIWNALKWWAKDSNIF